jgi:acetyl-CoA synthase
MSKGISLKHIGEAIYVCLMKEFGAVVDKCQITFITDEEKVKNLLEKEALPMYEARDSRIISMTDESVDRFFTCILCQSFAPNHCCIITPERLGLCGAVSWLDASTTKELTDTGPCQPIIKEGLIDEKKGIYKSVNQIVKDASHGAVSTVALYSMMEYPMTSCGCFECISGILPEANGVIITNREYKGITPTGMTFGELASMTGGGVQTPGFMGHGRQFISSKKYLRADGGLIRIVWMPKELKSDVGQKLNKTVKELFGIENFIDIICDETIATDIEKAVAFLEEKNHPALKMEQIV